MLKENSLKVYEYVKANDGVYTAKDIAAALELDPKVVNGIVTSAFQRKGLMTRVETEIELPDGTHDKVKLIHLTDAGRDFDPYAEPAKEA